MEGSSTTEIRIIDVEKDIDVLFELDNKVARATPALLPLETPQELIDFLIKEHKTDNYLLYDEAGKAAGYLSVMDFDDDSMEVLNLGTDPDLQGKGYGRKMMEYAEGLAKDKNKNKIRLVTNTKNDQAVGFYKNIGYSIVKEVENYYGYGETRYVFEKII